MVRLKRFGVSMERSLLGSFDRLLKKKGYTNRSEAIRGLVRRWLVEDEWSKGKGKVGVLLIVYDTGNGIFQPGFLRRAITTTI